MISALALSPSSISSIAALRMPVSVPGSCGALAIMSSAFLRCPPIQVRRTLVAFTGSLMDGIADMFDQNLGFRVLSGMLDPLSSSDSSRACFAAFSASCFSIAAWGFDSAPAAPPCATAVPDASSAPAGLRFAAITNISHRRRAARSAPAPENITQGCEIMPRGRVWREPPGPAAARPAACFRTAAFRW